MHLDEPTIVRILAPYVGEDGALACIEDARGQADDMRRRRADDSVVALSRAVARMFGPIAPASMIDRVLTELERAVG